MNPSAFSIAMSCRCTSTRPAVTFAMAHGAAIRAMIPNKASSRPSSLSLLAIEACTCCQVEYRSTAEVSAAPLYRFQIVCTTWLVATAESLSSRSPTTSWVSLAVGSTRASSFCCTQIRPGVHCG